MEKGKKHRHWVFTLNNPAGDDEAKIREKAEQSSVRYYTYQRERGVEGTEHLQGYIEFLGQTRFGAVKDVIGPRAHIEPRRGTRDEARGYCQKSDTRIEGTEPVEFGIWIKGQGHRTDLVAVARRLVEGSTVQQLAEEEPAAYIQFHRGMYALEGALLRKRKRPEVRTYIFWGQTRSGKTSGWRSRFLGLPLFAEEPDDFDQRVYEAVLPNQRGTFYADHYAGQDVIVFEEFKG
jgi:hypothetical protein